MIIECMLKVIIALIVYSLHCIYIHAIVLVNGYCLERLQHH